MRNIFLFIFVFVFSSCEFKARFSSEKSAKPTEVETNSEVNSELMSVSNVSFYENPLDNKFFYIYCTYIDQGQYYTSYIHIRLSELSQYYRRWHPGLVDLGDGLLVRRYCIIE